MSTGMSTSHTLPTSGSRPSQRLTGLPGTSSIRALGLATTFLLCSPLWVHAQTENDAARNGSIYSNIGYGSPADVSSPHAMGMGLRGVALYDPGTAGIINPAHWGKAIYTQGNVGLSFQGTDSRDNFGSAKGSLLSIGQFQFVAPLKKGKFGVSAALYPVSQSHYRIFREGTFIPEVDTLTFGIDNSGNGGVNRLEAGFGFAPNRYVSFGYAASVLMSTIDRTTNVFFSSSNYIPVTTSEIIQGSGFGQRAGLQITIPSVFSEENELGLGVSVDLPVSLDARKSRSGYRNVGGEIQLIDFIQDEAERQGEIKIPLDINAGLAYTHSNHLFVSAEATFQQWSQARYSFDRTQEEAFSDRIRVGLGAQYHPFSRKPGGGFFHNIKYSGGFTFDRGHLLIKDQRIQTLTAHAGFGLLNRRSSSTIDLHLKAGIRGTTRNDLVRETIWGIGFAINLAEIMFVRPKFQ